MRLGRFERPTSGSGDQRSIQLSYRRADERPHSTAQNENATGHIAGAKLRRHGKG